MKRARREPCNKKPLRRQAPSMIVWGGASPRHVASAVARMALLSVCVVARLPLVCLCLVPLAVHVCISQHVQTLCPLASTICNGVGLTPQLLSTLFQCSTHKPVDWDCAWFWKVGAADWPTALAPSNTPQHDADLGSCAVVLFLRGTTCATIC